RGAAHHAPLGQLRPGRGDRRARGGGAQAPLHRPRRRARPDASPTQAQDTMKTLLLAAVLALAALPSSAQQKIIPAQSSIRFVTTQMNVAVEGAFHTFDATVSFDPKHPEATKAEFEVDLGSIDLGTDEGDHEAKGKAWLNVAAFPKARFVASSVK